MKIESAEALSKPPLPFAPRWRTAGKLSFVAVVILCCTAPRYFRSRPVERCDLPCRDYAYKNFATPVTALSQRSIGMTMVRTVTGAPTTPAGTANANTGAGRQDVIDVPGIAVFQFTVPPLTIDHCSIDEIAVEVDDNGNCTLSLQADQNPVTAAPLGITPNVTTEQPLTKFTKHLRRNQFYVTLRFYGVASPTSGTAQQPRSDQTTPEAAALGEEMQVTTSALEQPTLLAQGPPTSSPLGRPVLAQFRIPPFWVERGIPYHLHHRCFSPLLRKYFTAVDQVEIEFTYRLAPDEKAP